MTFLTSFWTPLFLGRRPGKKNWQFRKFRKIRKILRLYIFFFCTVSIGKVLFIAKCLFGRIGGIKKIEKKNGSRIRKISHFLSQKTTFLEPWPPKAAEFFFGLFFGKMCFLQKKMSDCPKAGFARFGPPRNAPPSFFTFFGL